MQAPPRWAKDSLTQHYATATHNLWATFANKKPQHALLEDIDQHFVSLCSGLERSPTSKNLVMEGMFLLRAHVAFRAGALLVYSAQIPEAFPLFRSTIEYALYAFHIHTDEKAGEIWIKRSDSDDARKASRKEFTHQRVQNTLESRFPTLASDLSELYQRTIDFGGHPNDSAIFSAMQIEDLGNGKKLWKQEYFSGDGLSLDHGLKTAAQVGVGVLSIFEHIHTTRAQLLGLDIKLKELRIAL